MGVKKSFVGVPGVSIQMGSARCSKLMHSPSISHYGTTTAPNELGEIVHILAHLGMLL